MPLPSPIAAALAAGPPFAARVQAHRPDPAPDPVPERFPMPGPEPKPEPEEDDDEFPSELMPQEWTS